jgi:ABC-type uncharacterized transport system substrate-binding protein
MRILRNVWFWSVILSVTLAVCAPVRAVAHPHVYMDARVAFRFVGERLDGFEVEWTFDRMFTAQIALDYDTPRHGRFPRDLVDRIQSGAFDNLRHYDYFTYVVTDGRIHPVAEVRDFTAFMRNGRLVYRFFVPYHTTAGEALRTIRVRMYDKTFFADMAFHDDEPVTVISGDAVRHRTRVLRNEDIEVPYDATHPSVRRKEATYTGMAHPYEIVLEYRRVGR